MVGERIKTIRRQRGLSQAQLAHPELSDSYVSLIESGKRTPTPAVLELLAQKLDCSLTYLVNGVTAEQMEELEVGLRFARLALENGDLTEARRRFAELIEDKSLSGLPSLRQEAQYGYALASEACGDLPEAISTLNVLRESDGDSQTPEQRIKIGIALCRCYREIGDFEAAVRVGEDMTSVATASPVWNDDLIELGSTLLSVYIVRGDLLRARQFAGELLAAAEALGTPRAIVAACWNAALTAEEVGSGEEAMTLIERALAVQSENGEPRNLARLRSAYAKVQLRVRPAEALAVRDLSTRALEELKASAAGTTSIATCELNIAKAEMILGHPDEAADHAQTALDLAEAGTSDTVLASAQLVVSQVRWLQRRDEESLADLAKAEASLQRLPATRRTAEAWQTAAETFGQLGEDEKSVAAYQRALDCVGL
ncbi:helix-turn-helix domain-containing protein [Planotetraspora thailandica]|uniref:helix-turn-helix domain-containing protein n=1 Tax=Planotetraspora thailandica TaxID=487172 RepID=UPI001EF34EAE|nr:helix-turn-helix transcriptional regulator [Planotetraspora thailandica]